MASVDDLRRVVYAKAIAAVTGLNFPCRIGNEPFKQPTDGSLFGEFWIVLGDDKQIELGSAASYEMQVGIMQFTIYAPENSGDGPSYKMGSALKTAFNRKEWLVAPGGNVKIGTVAVKCLPGTHDGHVVTIVDGSFKFYHNNPDANFT